MTGGSQGTGGTSMGRQRGARGGRAPKGYKRSDERIREDICDRLMQNDDVDASDVEVNVSSGEVTLSGTVDNRQMKHLIENVVDAVQGVMDVHNQIRVKRQNHETGEARNAQDGHGTHAKGSETKGTSGSTEATGGSTRTAGHAQGQETQKNEGKADKNQETKGHGTETRRNSAS